MTIIARLRYLKFLLALLFCMAGLFHYRSRLLGANNLNLIQKNESMSKAFLPITSASCIENPTAFDTLQIIFRNLGVTDLINVSKTSTYLQQAVANYISYQASEGERLILVTEAFRELEKLRAEESKWATTLVRFFTWNSKAKKEAAEAIEALKDLLGQLFDKFKTGDAADWQIDQMKQNELSICCIADIKTHTKLKLAILDALDMEKYSLVPWHYVFPWFGSHYTDGLYFNAYIANAKLKVSSKTPVAYKHRTILDIHLYLIQKENSFSKKTFKKLAKDVLEFDDKLSDVDKRLLSDLEFERVQPAPIHGGISMRHILIAGHFANESNLTSAWSFCSSADLLPLYYSLLALLEKKIICKGFLLKIVNNLNLSFDDDDDEMGIYNRILLKFLKGSAYTEVYDALFANINQRNATDGPVGGLSTMNSKAVLLEKKVVKDDYKSEQELFEIIRHPDFKPSFVLGVACAMKGISPEFIREMFNHQNIDDLESYGLKNNVEMNDVNVESLKVLIEVLLKFPKTLEVDESLLLDANVITKDEVMLELVKHAYEKTKNPANIEYFSCWSFPWTALYILEKIELEDGHDTGFFETKVGKEFKKWANERDRAKFNVTDFLERKRIARTNSLKYS